VSAKNIKLSILSTLFLKVIKKKIQKSITQKSAIIFLKSENPRLSHLRYIQTLRKNVIINEKIDLTKMF